MQKKVLFLSVALGVACLLFPKLASADAYNDRILQKITEIKKGMEMVRVNYPDSTISNCSCFVNYRDSSNQMVGDIILFYKNTNEILFTELQNGSSVSSARVEVNFESDTCKIVTTDRIGYGHLDNYFKVGSCKINKRTSCCCAKEEGNTGTKFYNCHAVTKTLDEADVSCDATIDLNSDGRCEAERFVPRSGVQPQKADTDVSLSAQTLQERARELNKVGTTSATVLIGRAVKLLMAFMGSILFALYIYAGLLWMLANGNDEKISAAKNILVWSTLGVAVMLGSYVLVDTLFKELGLF